MLFDNTVLGNLFEGRTSKGTYASKMDGFRFLFEVFRKYQKTWKLYCF